LQEGDGGGFILELAADFIVVAIAHSDLIPGELFVGLRFIEGIDVRDRVAYGRQGTRRAVQG
jgi:hypothetical protein